jgi:Flp pilus assembly protein protease CpaA
MPESVKFVITFGDAIALYDQSIQCCDPLIMDLHRIPNGLTGTTAVSFLPVALVFGMPASTIVLHVAFGAAVAVAIYIGFSQGGIAKLVASIGIWLGPTSSFFAFLAGTCTVLGLAAVVLVLVGRRTAAIPVLPFALVTLAGQVAIGYVTVPWL